jgi:cytochrome c
MKRIVRLGFVVALCAVIGSCGSKKEKEKEDYGNPETEESATQISASEIIAQGETLIKASDCKTCHHITNKLMGPAHTDVAKKYDFTKDNVKLLADKIIKGGAGVWGEVPMTAHPDITQGDAEKMARYVLSLDGEKEH